MHRRSNLFIKQEIFLEVLSSEKSVKVSEIFPVKMPEISFEFDWINIHKSIHWIISRLQTAIINLSLRLQKRIFQLHLQGFNTLSIVRKHKRTKHCTLHIKFLFVDMSLDIPNIVLYFVRRLTVCLLYAVFVQFMGLFTWAQDWKIFHISLLSAFLPTHSYIFSLKLSFTLSLVKRGKKNFGDQVENFSFSFLQFSSMTAINSRYYYCCLTCLGMGWIHSLVFSKILFFRRGNWRKCGKFIHRFAVLDERK